VIRHLGSTFYGRFQDKRESMTYFFGWVDSIFVDKRRQAADKVGLPTIKGLVLVDFVQSFQ